MPFRLSTSCMNARQVSGASLIAVTTLQIDHVEECGSLKCYEDIAPFLKRLTPESVSAFRVLCKICHQKFTNQQRQKRKENK
jgi:hypothetical protein